MLLAAGTAAAWLQLHTRTSFEQQPCDWPVSSCQGQSRFPAEKAATAFVKICNSSKVLYLEEQGCLRSQAGESLALEFRLSDFGLHGKLNVEVLQIERRRPDLDVFFQDADDDERPALPPHREECEATTSDRQEEQLPADVVNTLYWTLFCAGAWLQMLSAPEHPYPVQAKLLVAGAPFAALNAASLSPKGIISSFKAFKDRVYYGDILPPVGSQQISYARFMDLMHDKKVKRVILLSDGKVALVEVPVEGFASNYMQAKYDRKDERCKTTQFCLPRQAQSLMLA
jgi:hypothetical protein